MLKTGIHLLDITNTDLSKDENIIDKCCGGDISVCLKCGKTLKFLAEHKVAEDI